MVPSFCVNFRNCVALLAGLSQTLHSFNMCTLVKLCGYHILLSVHFFSLTRVSSQVKLSPLLRQGSPSVRAVNEYDIMSSDAGTDQGNAALFATGAGIVLNFLSYIINTSLTRFYALKSVLE